MRIKTKLTINAILPLGLLVLVGLTILYANHMVSKVERTERIAAEVRLKVSYLNSTVNYYLLRHEKESWAQIQKIDASLSELLSKMVPADPYEEKALRNLRSDHEAVRNILSRLAASWNYGEISRSSRELEERLTGYVLERTREMTANTLQLESMIGVRLARAHRNANILIFIFTAFFAVIIVAVSFLTSKRISTALHKLQRGTQTITEGNLDYKISVTATDELASLSRTFNNMAAELQRAHSELEKRVEERTKALKESEERWATTLVSIGDAVIATNVTGKITFMNAVAESLTGWMLPDAVEKPVAEVFHIVNEHTRVEVENPVVKVLREGMIVGLANHTILIRKDGAEVPIDDSGAPIRDGDGKTLGVVLVFRDIADRKRAEEAINASELRYRRLFESAKDGILILDFETGMVVDVNPFLIETLGLPREVFLGKKIWELGFFKNIVASQNRFKELQEEEFVRYEDLPLETEGGRKIDVEFISNVYKANHHKVIQCNIRDITDRKLAEEALREAHDSLELRVQERTAELSQAYETLQREVSERERLEEQLRQAHKMQAIGTLAGGIAHDFNNILAAILGFTEMAIDDVPDRPLVEKNLKNVLKSSMRARDLVKQILTFSRKTNYERSPLSVTPLMDETVHLLRASIPTTIEIRLSNAASSDAVLASPVEVQQVLMNLATNASLAMQERGGVLEINLSDIDFEPDSPVFGVEVAPGEYLQLAVKDTGVGMSPDVMKRVFEPFFTTREAGKGTGMGLAVVYGIVKDLQGAINVESAPGVGFTFRVFLPKVKIKAKEEQLRAVQIPGGKERILFVDDEQMLVDLGEAALERLGYSVVPVTDSTEALRTFSSDPSKFDLVITDQTMSGLTGVQLAEALLKVRPDIPIILCTGHSETVSADIAKEAGIREYLMKPLAKQELATAIRRVLNGKAEG